MIRSMKVQRKSLCESRCYQEPNCVSYNYGPIDSDTPSCDLNNRTHFQSSSSDFVTKQSYTYRHVLNSCQSSPCPRNLTCQTGFTAEGYRCVCELDFILGTGSLAGSCYKLFTEPETWSNARANCESLGAQLAKIESAVENDFIKRTFLTSSGRTFWIGLSDQLEEGKWMWTDGSPLENYFNWEARNPNNLGGYQNCGHISMGTFSLSGYDFHGYDGWWNDLECDVALGYICERLSP
ncbi:hypothetical protein ACROYT_G022903 [Oculina patagonica]